MGRKDPHDKREFQHFVRLNPDGTVAAVIEISDAGVADALAVAQTDLRASGGKGQADATVAIFADQLPAPRVNITELPTFDTTKLKLDPKKLDLSDAAAVADAVEAAAPVLTVTANDAQPVP